MNRPYGAWGAADGAPDSMLAPLVLDPVLQRMRMADPYTPGSVLMAKRQAQLAAEAAARAEAQGEAREDRRERKSYLLVGLAVAIVFGFYAGKIK